MSWRNRPPKREDYETEEEFNNELDSFYDAMESDAEERRCRRMEDEV